MTTTQVTAANTPRGVGRIIALAVGDTITFIIFSAIGRGSHAEAAGLSALPQIVETAAPFLIGWFVVAPIVGAYRSQLTNTPRRMLGRTALAWLIAWPIGLGLRALIRQSGIPLTFAAITFLTVLIMIGLWRLAFALVAKQRSHV